MELEPGFGIQPYMRHEAFPPSAYQGPFFFLLRHHFALGKRFLIELLNHSAEWYSSGRVPMQYVEPPDKFQLTFSDGSSQEQWGNSRLWNLYRGNPVGPYALQSALMALERCLLEIAEEMPEVVDAILVNSLKASRSAVITAVVASVAISHPHACLESLLVLLRSPQCILLDRLRMVSESQGSSAMMPSLSSNKTHDQEREESDGLPHRSRDLENAIIHLQLGQHSARVQEVIDEHLKTVPPTESRTEEDRIWLLSLRRMDMRRYEATEVQEETHTQRSSDNERRKMIRFDLALEETDLKEMSDKAITQYSAMDKRIGLQMWGMKVFERDTESDYDPRQWRLRLAEALDMAQTRRDETLGRSGPEFVATVCIRDHFDELTEDEARWCIETVCSAIERTADFWNHSDRTQRDSMGADRPCARSWSSSDCCLAIVADRVRLARETNAA